MSFLASGRERQPSKNQRLDACLSTNHRTAADGKKTSIFSRTAGTQLPVCVYAPWSWTRALMFFLCLKTLLILLCMYNISRSLCLCIFLAVLQCRGTRGLWEGGLEALQQWAPSALSLLENKAGGKEGGERRNIAGGEEKGWRRTGEGGLGDTLWGPASSPYRSGGLTRSDHPFYLEKKNVFVLLITPRLQWPLSWSFSVAGCHGDWSY